MSVGFYKVTYNRMVNNVNIENEKEVLKQMLMTSILDK